MGVGLRFGAGPLRVYIPLSRRRRRRPRRPGPPRKPLPKPVVFGAAVFLIGCGVWGAIAGPLPKPDPTPTNGSTRTLAVSRATFRSTWPLTVDSAVLACPEANVTTLTAGGVVYALSPEAELTGRYANMGPIMAGNVTQPGIADGITELADEGEALC